MDLKYLPWLKDGMKVKTLVDGLIEGLSSLG
jgi:hypothetical protein